MNPQENKAQQEGQSSKEKSADEKVNFGFKRVNLNEKQGMVNEVFDSVANKYLKI